MDTLVLYLRYISASMRSQMQYKLSFFLTSAGYFFSSIIDFVGIAVLIGRFGALKGWNIGEIALFYGLSQLSFAFTESWMRGFNVFNRYIIDGRFDRILLRPRGVAMQVLAAEFQLMRVGRFIQGGAILWYGILASGIAWRFSDVLMLVGGLIGGVLVFSGIILIQATSCFWTVESLEAFNMFTYGGLEAMHYPLDIYNGWLRRALTFVLPLAAGGWIPIGAILGRVVPYPAGFLSPFIGLAFLLCGYAFWLYGLRYYESTGS